MSIKGDVVMTINGQRVEGIREVTFTETCPNGYRPEIVFYDWRVVRPPRPSPKQYRLKRRAAGSKRRNKGKQ